MVLVVDEAVDDRGHGDAEDGGAIVRDPGALGNIAEVLHAGQVGQVGQVALIIERQRSIEGAARDQVAGCAGFNLALRAALYSVGAAGEKTTLMPGFVLRRLG